MNKKILIIVVILLLLLGGGYWFMNLRVTDVDPGNAKPVENSDLFTSIKDALSKNMTLVCDFTDEYGNATKSYVKGGAVRVSMTGDGRQAGEIIINNKKMYMWDNKKKEGFVYTIPDEPEDNQTGVTSQDIVSSESYLDMIDKYKDSCKVATVEDSYFEVPTDINFQDMSKLLEDIKNNGSYNFN